MWPGFGGIVVPCAMGRKSHVTIYHGVRAQSAPWHHGATITMYPGVIVTWRQGPLYHGTMATSVPGQWNLGEDGWGGVKGFCGGWCGGGQKRSALHARIYWGHKVRAPPDRILGGKCGSAAHTSHEGRRVHGLVAHSSCGETVARVSPVLSVG